MDKKIYKSVPVKASEITPEHIYYSRRDFLKTMGIVGSGVLLTACGVASTSSTSQSSPSPARTIGPTSSNPVDELGDPANTYDEITHYNNYYEFTEDKGGVAVLSKDFKPTKGKGLGPWDLEVYGLVNKPMTFSLEDILSKFSQGRSAFTVCAASKPGPWSSPGPVFPCQNCWLWLSRSRMPSSCASSRFMTRIKCPDSTLHSIPGLTRRGCAWTRRCMI